MAVDFDNRFQSFRNDNFVIALTLWRIVRYSFGAHRVKIVSYSSISDVIAETQYRRSARDKNGRRLMQDGRNRVMRSMFEVSYCLILLLPMYLSNIYLRFTNKFHIILAFKMFFSDLYYNSALE